MNNPPQNPDEKFPIYKYVPLWVQQYGSAGVPDQRAVETFMECEGKESIGQLRAELLAIKAGKFKVENLDKVVGVKRRTLFPSYQDWARVMLLWMAGYKG